MPPFPVDWKSCYSGTEPCELERLQYYCKLIDPSATPNLAIEIGSHEGASAALLSEWFSYVISIDPWGHEDLLSPEERMASYVSNPGSNRHFPVYMANMDRLDLFDKRVIPIVGTSQVLNAFPCLNAELIFVDDGHVYSACSADITSSLRHLRPGGLLVCHDYCRPGFGRPPYDPNHPHHSSVDPYIGVQQAVDEAIQKYNLEVVDHFEGIIALRKRQKMTNEIDNWPICRACDGIGSLDLGYGNGTCCQCNGIGRVNPALKNKTANGLRQNPLHEWNK